MSDINKDGKDTHFSIQFWIFKGENPLAFMDGVKINFDLGKFVNHDIRFRLDGKTMIVETNPNTDKEVMVFSHKCSDEIRDLFVTDRKGMLITITWAVPTAELCLLVNGLLEVKVSDVPR